MEIEGALRERIAQCVIHFIEHIRYIVRRLVGDNHPHTALKGHGNSADEAAPFRCGKGGAVHRNQAAGDMEKKVPQRHRNRRFFTAVPKNLELQSLQAMGFVIVLHRHPYPPQHAAAPFRLRHNKGAARAEAGAGAALTALAAHGCAALFPPGVFTGGPAGFNPRRFLIPGVNHASSSCLPIRLRTTPGRKPRPDAHSPRRLGECRRPSTPHAPWSGR